MNVFDIHNKIVSDYSSYISSFINIADKEVADTVKRSLEKGKLWPNPLLQFNPAFMLSGKIDEVVSSGILHTSAKSVFKGYSLYRHQLEAVQLGVKGRDFVVTSGTGSGKSFTYIATIFDRLLREPDLEGVSAIIVYPMNALINSQSNELEIYKSNYEKSTGREFPITFGQYTGQEKEERRQQMRENPPQILLTNYMMLELLLTRLQERGIRDAIYNNLQYLVFDELHTYRGRQGADVAMLIRRIRAMCKQPVACIGTSATLVSKGPLRDRSVQVAKVATKIFGKTFESDQIIDETLTKSLEAGENLSVAALRESLLVGIDTNQDETALRSHPLSNWLENEIALEEKDGRLIRRTPLAVDEVVAKISDASGLDKATCLTQLAAMLLWISKVNQRIQETGSRYTILPFKLHQFFAQTGSVYTTLDRGTERFITLEPGIYQESAEHRKPIYPNVFSRESGHPFLCVTWVGDQLQPREFRESSANGALVNDGYLIVGEDIWDPDTDMDYLPEAWVKIRANGRVPDKKKEPFFPKKIYFDETGKCSTTEGLKYWGWFMSEPLLFDPTSGTFFETRTNEGTKLSKLGSEGRSTSTTITAFSILNRLNEAGINLRDQKLLSFTDNRQDAALQSGHFNDFVRVIQLRSAIHRALLEAPHNELDFTVIGKAVFDALALSFSEFANSNQESELAFVRRKYEEALQSFLFFRVLADLKRSWRIVLPNLEQCGLLRVEYKDFREVVEADSFWSDCPVVRDLNVEERSEFLMTVLDFFRLEQAIYSANYLDRDRLKEFEKQFRENLKAPWTLDPNEKLQESAVVRIDALNSSKGIYSKSMGPTSGVGKWIKQVVKEKGIDAEVVKGDNYRRFVQILLDKLTAADFLISTNVRNAQNQNIPVYQLRIERVIWKAGDGESVKPDLIKRRSYKSYDPKPNVFFRELYKVDFRDRKALRAEDHTGQLKSDDRIDRELRFRAEWFIDDEKTVPNNEMIKRNAISALFCSPTMELGIDIGGLSVVHMRNAPPNPANYSQRSGRAGRSGQGALVFTYCSSYSPHDRHYFEKQAELVYGSVRPPNIDLMNRELFLTHLNAFAISEIGLPGLDGGGGGSPSLMRFIDEYDPQMPIAQSVRDGLSLSSATLDALSSDFKRVVSDLKDELETGKATWYTDDWIRHNLVKLDQHLDQSLGRWRKLYKSASEILSRATDKLAGGLLQVHGDEYKKYSRQVNQATRQLNLLRNDTGKFGDLSEFYPYRYLAAEGFFPGYNFTRLPLRIFVPEGSTSGDFISRSRAVALREFGPLNLIYHKGRKFQVQQLVVQELDASLAKAKISKRAGYFLSGDDSMREICPFSGANLGDNANVEFLNNLLEMSESRAEEVDRISCEEEERSSRGFDINTYFSVDAGGFERIRKSSVMSTESKLLNLRFIPAARLVHVSNKWRSQSIEGYPIGITSGDWRTSMPSQDDNLREAFVPVKLWTSSVADALYIEPIQSLGLSADGVITLQYALKRAIETVFQVESDEIGVVAMGEAEAPNILLYEAAEGSLGILSQFVEDVDVFNKVVLAAREVCRFEEFEYKAPASYDDLLSYYNQRDHTRINRFLIKDALEKLEIGRIEIQANRAFSNYDEHYQNMLATLDQNSSTEKQFIEFLYKNGIRLPDKAQKRVEGIYCQPDFYYEPRIWIFCDGTPHDDPAVRARDFEQRELIKSRGDEVWFWHYRENLAEKIAKRPDIFKKVK